MAVGHKEIEVLDLLWGVNSIARFIGRTDQQVFHMIRTGALPPVKKVGERYCAERNKLVAFFTNDAA